METIKITEAIPSPHNLNTGTADGAAMITTSLTKLKVVRPSILLDRNNQVVTGHHFLQSAKALGYKEIDVVDVTGNELLVHKRLDMDLADPDDHAAKLAEIADNQTSEVNYNLDLAEFKNCLDAGVDFSVGYFENEIADILARVNEPIAADDKSMMINLSFTETQYEQVKAVLLKHGKTVEQGLMGLLGV